MKFVCIADTHSFHERIKIADGDVFIHAGDFTNIGKLEDVEQFNEFLGKLPHKYKIVVAGNHDLSFEINLKETVKLLTNATYLHDSAMVIDGIRIYGSPWQPEFMNWAFGLPRGAEIRKKWDLIPKGTDILVTHGPPYGICDKSMSDNHLGCEELVKVVKIIKPKFHIFGHIHGGYGQLSDTNTTYINASICNDSYEPVNSAVTFTL